MQTVRPADRLHERFLTEDCYMVFSTPVFLFAFLPAVLLLFYLVPRRLKTLILLLSSLFFYFWGERAYTALMVFSIVVNYGSGLVIAALKSRGKAGGAKAMLIVSVVINLGMLIFFKYWDFLAESLQGLGLGFLPVLGIHLPIGISFYTFQTMSYTIDVYRADVPAQKNPVAFGAYVTMFPQLIAGPIVRYKDVAEQLDCRGVSWERFASGVFRFTVGLAKKLLLANALGQIWSGFRDVPTAELTVAGAWLGVLAFSLQIYFDFSGYSDMAIGLGRMLGFEFLENFRYPYASDSITEFWRRWHISLSNWFRDYLYIPLGGNRRSKPRWLLNLLVVWMATGMWHGASWNFILWGLYFGIILVIEKLWLLKPIQKLPALGHVYSLLAVYVGWGIFYFDDFGTMQTFFKTFFHGMGDWSGFDVKQAITGNLWLWIAALTLCLPVRTYAENRIKNPNIKYAIRTALSLVILLLSVSLLVGATNNAFLYFRF